MIADGFVALGGFGDLWLFGDPEQKYRRRTRDLRADIVAARACPICGAPVGELCRRDSVGGPLLRRLPHVGRGKPGRKTLRGKPEEGG